MIRATRGDTLFETSADTFESGMARIQRVAETMLARLTDLPRRPDHVRAEFGLRVTAEAGLVVAKGSGDAHIKLELEWNRAEGEIRDTGGRSGLRVGARDGPDAARRPSGRGGVPDPRPAAAHVRPCRRLHREPSAGRAAAERLWAWADQAERQALERIFIRLVRPGEELDAGDTARTPAGSPAAPSSPGATGR